MVNLYSKNCNHPGCDKIPWFGVEGSKKMEFCAEHAVQGMIYLRDYRTSRSGPITYRELIPFTTVEHALNVGFSAAKANSGSLVRAGMTYREVSCTLVRHWCLEPLSKVIYNMACLNSGGDARSD